jgi:hypothetical protein
LATNSIDNWVVKTVKLTLLTFYQNQSIPQTYEASKTKEYDPYELLGLNKSPRTKTGHVRDKLYQNWVYLD